MPRAPSSVYYAPAPVVPSYYAPAPVYSSYYAPSYYAPAAVTTYRYGPLGRLRGVSNYYAPAPVSVTATTIRNSPRSRFYPGRRPSRDGVASGLFSSRRKRSASLQSAPLVEQPLRPCGPGSRNKSATFPLPDRGTIHAYHVSPLWAVLGLTLSCMPASPRYAAAPNGRRIRRSTAQPVPANAVAATVNGQPIPETAVQRATPARTEGKARRGPAADPHLSSSIRPCSINTCCNCKSRSIPRRSTRSSTT